MRNNFFKYLVFGLVCYLLSNYPQYCHSQSPSLGAIRWDAWTGSENTIGAQVEQALSPGKYHYRVPFFGVETDTGSVRIDGTSQLIMDQEIQFANYAGLDYWAFVWYASATGLDEARELYYKSTKKDMIDYCLIVEHSSFCTQLQIDELVNEFLDRSYVRVLNGRPLLYFLGYSSIKVADIDSLRDCSVAAGAGNPYIVELRMDENMNVVDELHLDAFGMYATTWISHGVPYKELAEADIAQWDWVGKNSGYKVVPHVTTGWDTRPIHDHPLSWYTVENSNDFVEAATPSEIAGHIMDAINWNSENPSLAEANTILIYAWNEHVEGGWICPTLSGYGSTDRIDTLHAIFGKDPNSTHFPSEGKPLLVYPNPTKNNLHLNLHGHDLWTLKDISGLELMRGMGPDCDLSYLSSGLYFLQVNGSVRKVIKI